MSNNSNNASKATSMRVGLDELKKMVGEAVKKTMTENTGMVLTEGPSEIAVRMVLEDLKEVIVGSLTEDLVRELKNKEEKMVETIVSSGYEAMAREIIRNIDKTETLGGSAQLGGAPRRKTVVFNPTAGMTEGKRK